MVTHAQRLALADQKHPVHVHQLSCKASIESGSRLANVHFSVLLLCTGEVFLKIDFVGLHGLELQGLEMC